MGKEEIPPSPARETVSGDKKVGSNSIQMLNNTIETSQLDLHGPQPCLINETGCYRGHPRRDG